MQTFVVFRKQSQTLQQKVQYHNRSVNEYFFLILFFSKSWNLVIKTNYTVLKKRFTLTKSIKNNTTTHNKEVFFIKQGHETAPKTYCQTSTNFLTWKLNGKLYIWRLEKNLIFSKISLLLNVLMLKNISRLPNHPLTSFDPNKTVYF